MRRLMYLDNLTVGQRFTSSTHTLDADQIRKFAAEYDPQPFHLDDGAAEDSFFKGLAASEWHVVSLTMRLLTSGELSIAGGFIGIGAELSWPKPTRPGDILRVTGEVAGVRPPTSKPNRGVVTLCIEAENQHDDALLRLTVKLLVFRRHLEHPHN